MADWNDEQRTEQPTARRREEARREGKIAKSSDLVVAGSLLAVFLVLESWGPAVAERTFGLIRSFVGKISIAPQMFTEEGSIAFTLDLSSYLLYGALPVSLVVCSLVVLGFACQGVGLIVPNAITPQLSRLDPIAGLGRMANVDSWRRGVFAALKLAVVGLCLWSAIGSRLGAHGYEGVEDLYSTWFGFWSGLTGFGVTLSLALIALAVLDYVAQRWIHERSLRMTREEIREEALREEGDQTLKNRRLGMLRELRREPRIQED